MNKREYPEAGFVYNLCQSVQSADKKMKKDPQMTQMYADKLKRIFKYSRTITGKTERIIALFPIRFGRFFNLCQSVQSADKKRKGPQMTQMYADKMGVRD